MISTLDLRISSRHTGEGRSIQQALAPGASFGGPVVPLNASVQVPPGYVVRAVWRGIGTQNYTSVNGVYTLVGVYATFYAKGSSTVVGHVEFAPNGTGAPYVSTTSVDSSVSILKIENSLMILVHSSKMTFISTGDAQCCNPRLLSSDLDRQIYLTVIYANTTMITLIV